MSTPERYQTWSVPPQDLRLHHSASQKGEEALKNSSGECVNEWVSESERVSPQVFRQWQNLFVLTDLGPWTLTNRNFSKNWWEARWGTQARLHWDSCSTREWKQVTGTLLAPREGSLAPIMGESGDGSADREGGMGWLRRSADPFGGAVCRAHAQYPALAPGASEVVLGFGLFVSYCL